MTGDDAVVGKSTSDERAGAETTERLDLTAANKIIGGAFASAERDGVPPLAVVVLDDAGHLISGQRADGASMFRMDVATGKAWAAVGMGSSSAVLAQRAAENPVFFTSLAATAQGRFLAQPGAVLIRDQHGTLLGAAGASGGTGEQDAACCAAGIRAAGLVAEE
ncbi:GlcG/HbpS family heme-binding protein [Microlunatus soli]|uniref:Uncharacterized conserved protein GlcG, DUF336 family n=1 Tax=Microlunatus soli TaxID=630515 RepID=A0A1H1QJT9_9ACTN|nr:heme-binding protein [Microlunatus soli]SDS23732.1 Uncharacterized conserved protein GlcG, DUF336 family [Microlunatus soli]